MKIIADTNKVALQDFEALVSGAYRDKTIDVELSPEYDGLSVWAIFDRQSVKVEGGKCYTPTLERGTCSVGIYAVRLNNEKEIDLRYSPAPALINIEQGSYNSSLNSATTPTESEVERIYALIDEAIKAGLLKGEKGDPGTPGKDGAPGKDGYTPIKGIDYFDGVKGDKGDKGEQGLQGASGKNGADGKNATINGKNAINILAGDNISLNESGDDIQISASNQKQIATNENDVTDITEIVIDDVDNPLIIDNEITKVSNGIASSQAVYKALLKQNDWELIRTITVPENPEEDSSDIIWKTKTVDGKNYVIGFAFNTDQNGEEYELSDFFADGSVKVKRITDNNDDLLIYNDDNLIYRGYRNFINGYCWTLFFINFGDKCIPLALLNQQYVPTYTVSNFSGNGHGTNLMNTNQSWRKIGFSSTGDYCYDIGTKINFYGKRKK